jgi:doublecortin
MMTEYDQQHDDQHDHQQHDRREQQQQQQQRSTMLERGRAIKLMRNGDLYFPGRQFVINQRKYPMLDVFLDDASQSLRANFGAVRCIYTPKNGTRVHDISELEDHRTYVAAGGERFKKLQ